MMGDKIMIHDLELFVGYDESVDDPDDEKVRAYDRKKIEQVIARTTAMMEKGQNPKLILGHNPDDDDGSVRPAIGDIVSIRLQDINGVSGIVGDIEMSTDVFATTFGSNSFPRRSAEIWSDGYMSEVALLGSQTPARPLPDTKFVKDGLTRTIFSRDLPYVGFDADVAHIYGDPGPANTSIPESDDMPDVKEDELTQLKAKCKAMEDEMDKMKSTMHVGDEGDDYDHDEDEDKDKHAKKRRRTVRSIEIQRDSFARDLATQKQHNQEMRADLLAERYGRTLDEMSMSGYRLGDASQRTELLDEIVGSADPDMSLADAKDACDAKLAFMKRWIAKDPTGLRIDQTGVRIPAGDGGGLEKYERDAGAAERARDRCTSEGTTDGVVFAKYYAEEQQKTG